MSDRSAVSQYDRLSRQVNHWRTLAAEDRDLILLGDANLDAMKWENNDYINKDLANLVIDFNLEESVSQLVSENTRTELRGGRVEKSCIDHVSTNCPLKCTKVSVIEDELGSSDHLGVAVQKFTKELQNKPQTTKKRSFKNFNQDNFIMEVRNTDFSSVTNEHNLEEAAKEFSTIFKNIQDNHAPIKIFQNRKNYAPWLSDTTKELIKKRNDLKNK